MSTRRKFFSFLGLSAAGAALLSPKAKAVSPSSSVPGLHRVIYLKGIAIMEGADKDFVYGGNGRFKFNFDLKGSSKKYPDVMSVQLIDNGHIRTLSYEVIGDVPEGTWIQLFKDLPPTW